MKKLVMMVVVAALSLGLNAAMCNWAAYDIVASDNAVIYGFESTKVSQQAMLDAFLADNISEVIELGYVGTIDADEAFGDILGYDNGVNTSAYVAIIDGANLFISDLDYSKTGLSGQAASSEFELGDAMAHFYQGGTTTFEGAGWYSAAAVPEPTSGLLLLLGMGALALRRKQA